MHLLIDGYNLLYAGRCPNSIHPASLPRERDRLIDTLSAYRRARPCRITIVFDGWQAGWATESREKRKGIDLVFSRVGEKADEVIKRLARSSGAGAVVVSSDLEIRNYAEGLKVPVIPSDQFREKMRAASLATGPRAEKNGEGEGPEEGQRKKGPSRRLSKKEKRRRTALKKL